jgi:anthranilate phosphoribosyltransferase
MSDGFKNILGILHLGMRPDATALESAFAAILNGEATPSQIGAFLMGLEHVGVDSRMIHAGAKAMRAAMLSVPTTAPCVDVCGTGGDGSHTLNISTAVSFVLAGCGLNVAKHGNRAMSSTSGAADVLEALGVNLAVSAPVVAQAIDEVGVGFMFAQAHHPAMAHVGPSRRELGFRTIFNMLGPLSNPAGAAKQLVGVYAADKILPMAEALRLLGCAAAWVVHGDGGLDEIALSGPSQVAALNNGAIESFQITPEDAGLSRAPLSALKGGDAAYNATALRALLAGVHGPYRDSVSLNAAAALVAFGKADSLIDGVTIAQDAIDSGRSNQALAGLIAITNGRAQKVAT